MANSWSCPGVRIVMEIGLRTTYFGGENGG